MRFRRRPGTIEAWRWDGTLATAEAIQKLAGDRVRISGPNVFVRSDRGQSVPVWSGEWIVKVDERDWYPIAHEKFMARYEPDE